MSRLLQTQPAMADRLITHMLSRNARIEEDLTDQIFDSSEKRLARTLLLTARYGRRNRPARAVPAMSPRALADTIGSTPTRVEFLLKKFERLGFIDYHAIGRLTINRTLLSVVLHD